MTAAGVGISGRSKALSIAVVLAICIGLLLPSGDRAQAHSGAASPFYEAGSVCSATGCTVFEDPRLTLSAGTLTWDAKQLDCRVGWPENWQEIRREIDPVTGEPLSNWIAVVGHGTRPNSCDEWVNPFHWSVSAAGAAYELRFVTGSGTVWLRAKTCRCGEAPLAPTDLSVSEVTSASVSLSWTDNSDNETEFELQRSEDQPTGWTTVGTLAADQTSHTDEGLTPGQTYWYRVRTSNANGNSAWSNEREVTPGCELDTDCDGLSNSDETELLHTDPNKPDTDGDGLLDPWESPDRVGVEEIENAGFHFDGIPGSATSVDVFSPFGTAACPGLGSNQRWSGQVACMNGPPDPLHKDVYLELDWQDCSAGEGCPHGDPMHHGPDVDGLQLARAEFADADVSNPDGNAGINLHILIDESVDHNPNCDRDSSDIRWKSFGTADQRNMSSVVLLAKRQAVRYVWSGHSSADPADHGGCETPSQVAIGATAFGYRQIEDYDWSPFGDANVGGRDILITLGPLWSCDERVKPLDGMGAVVEADCYRDEAMKAGIYPASVHVPARALPLDLPWPVARMLGLPEPEGITQLWGRSLMHLLGHSLGLSEDEVNNRPSLPAVDGDANGVIDPPTVESYDDWTSLVWIPAEGVPITEAPPNYEFLAQRDSDLDGVPEGSDNCPGVYNPGQEDADLLQGDRTFGDACDWDADGDGLPVVALGSGLATDPFPFDTDNDGTDNLDDWDDDGDLRADTRDVCPLTADVLQSDLDRDGIGDACDIDRDGDGVPEPLQ